MIMILVFRSMCFTSEMMTRAISRSKCISINIEHATMPTCNNALMKIDKTKRSCYIATPKQRQSLSNVIATYVHSVIHMNLKRYLFHSSRIVTQTLRMASPTTTAAAAAAATTWDDSSGGRIIKGFFAGSGSDMMNDPRPIEAILKLVPKQEASDVKVVYLGTATYDIEQFYQAQTQRFMDAGCQVRHLKTTDEVPSDFDTVFDEVDVVVVAGGNTLFALDRWKNLNMIPLLRKAMERGTVMSGGSAGAICWFDGGHSDSCDPDSFMKRMLTKFADDSSMVVTDESDTGPELKDWNYIRVPALQFLPGLLCPHHDRIQSNGVLRADDFDRLLLESPGELGIGIDHWAALVVDGEDYHVMSLEDKEGSVKNGIEFVTDGSGKPGIWIKEVTTIDGKDVVTKRICPKQGKVKELLRKATKVVNNEAALRQCRADNPQPN